MGNLDRCETKRHLVAFAFRRYGTCQVRTWTNAPVAPLLEGAAGGRSIPRTAVARQAPGEEGGEPRPRRDKAMSLVAFRRYGTCRWRP